MSRRKIKMRYPKARYSHAEAVLAFYAQDIKGMLWRLDETARWWVFRLRGER